MNEVCDDLASGLAESVATGDASPNQEDILAMPYKGSRVMLKKGDKWVVSNYVQEIQGAQ